MNKYLDLNHLFIHLMKFYITVEPSNKLKHIFTNLGSFYIIDVDTLIFNSGLDINNASHVFLINSEISRLISIAAKSKRNLGIIYINSNINCDSIVGLKLNLGEITNDNIDSFVILDDYDLPKLKEYYNLFDEVIFFPTFKKTKIIQCSARTFTKSNKHIHEKNYSEDCSVF